MSNQEMWESRYREQKEHTPDGTEPHPVVIEQAEEVIAGATSAGESPGDLRAVDLGSGSGRHTVALAELGMSVTAVDFAASAHDVVQRDARERGVEDRVTSVTADVASWEPEGSFDLIVAAYLHIEDLGILRNTARWLAPGGRLVWIAHAPESPHGPPATVVRESLDDYRRELEPLDSQLSVVSLEEYQLNPEFLDIIAIIENPGK